MTCLKVHFSSSQAYVWRQAPRCSASKITLDNNVVVTAPSRKPFGVVHFLGGAFAGAAPAIAYESFLNALASAGYTSISTPYATSFDHQRSAEQVHSLFLSSLEQVRASPRWRWAAPEGTTLHGIGHSNGALLHAIIASSYNATNLSNILISFNNRQVADAVPIPLDPLSAAIQPLRGIAGSSLESAAQSAASQALQVAGSFQATVTGWGAPGNAIELLRELLPAATQVGSVLDEVGDGAVEFSPTPEENQRSFAASYAVPHTLLVQFSDDSIDQTAELYDVLARPSSGMSRREVELAKLVGTHVTPVGVDLKWQAGPRFGPVDALAQFGVQATQADKKRLTESIARWLRSL